MNAPIRAREAQRIAEMNERAQEISEGRNPEWNAFMDGMLARCAAARVKHVPLKFRSEAQELADADRADGGPDKIGNVFA